MELYLKVRLACSEGMTQRQAAKHFNSLPRGSSVLETSSVGLGPRPRSASRCLTPLLADGRLRYGRHPFLRACLRTGYPNFD